jgi:hypothetical protein
VEEKGVSSIVVIAIVVIIAIAAIVGGYFLVSSRGPRAPISEKDAITKIKTYVAGVEKIPKENIQIDNIELRSPTESEENLWRELGPGKEPPELIWFANVTVLFGYVGPRGAEIWLNASTGEIVAATFLD